MLNTNQIHYHGNKHFSEEDSTLRANDCYTIAAGNRPETLIQLKSKKNNILYFHHRRDYFSNGELTHQVWAPINSSINLEPECAGSKLTVWND